MRTLATIRMALRALLRNKMRTVLTMLGIIIGVGAVIAMVGIGNGAKSQIESQIASLGRECHPYLFRQLHSQWRPQWLGRRRHAQRR